MIQEEKAKAYDEAIERARKVLLDKETTNHKVAEFIFPELAESEDERIRRWLVSYFETISKHWLHDNVMPLNSILSWLEKQKDADKAILAVDMIDKYIDQNVTNAHDMKDSNPQKKYCQGIDNTLSDISGILQDVYSEKKSLEQEHDEICASIANELRPYIWSEEDERNIRNLESVLYYDKRLPEETRTELGNFLKSLKPQSKQKLIDDDKNTPSWNEIVIEEMLDFYADLIDNQHIYVPTRFFTWLTVQKEHIQGNNISISPERLKELRDQSFEDGRKAGIAEMAKSMPMPEDTVLFQNGVKEGRRLEREDMPRWKENRCDGGVTDKILNDKNVIMADENDTLYVNGFYMDIKELYEKLEIERKEDK